MERLKQIKNQLISEVEVQMGDLKCVDTRELGEVIDMIYDLSKSIYYCTVVKAMEEKEEKKTPIMSYEDQQDSDYLRAEEHQGRSGMRRKMYMESKSSHADISKKIQDLENYMRELTNDIMEMMQDASPEEKAVLQKKVTILSTKIQNI